MAQDLVPSFLTEHDLLIDRHRLIISWNNNKSTILDSGVSKNSKASDRERMNLLFCPSYGWGGWGGSSCIWFAWSNPDLISHGTHELHATVTALVAPHRFCLCVGKNASLEVAINPSSLLQLNQCPSRGGDSGSFNLKKYLYQVLTHTCIHIMSGCSLNNPLKSTGRLSFLSALRVVFLWGPFYSIYKKSNVLTFIKKN